jgi:hypothetical protein
LLLWSGFAQPIDPGWALAFDGTGGYVLIDTAGWLSGTFTVEFWANPNDNSPTSLLLLMGSRRPTDFSFDSSFWQGNFVHGDLGNGFTWISTSANVSLSYSTNTWYHLAYVVTPTNYSIYVDGTPLATATYPPDNPLLYDDTHRLVVGNFGEELPTDEAYMNGQIDEVRIWSTARTASQIQTNAFRSLTGDEPGLMGYWGFDEGSGLTTADASPNRFVGALIATARSRPRWVVSTFPYGKLLILNQPQGQVIPAGADLDLSVSVFGADPLTYQWRFNLTNLPAATNATLRLTNVEPSTSGAYSVLVSNSFSSVVSSSALVTVIAPRLEISPATRTVLLWWPTNASGFTLEASPHLGANQNWTAFPGPVQVISDQNVFVAHALTGERFFRLRKQ